LLRTDAQAFLNAVEEISVGTVSGEQDQIGGCATLKALNEISKACRGLDLVTFKFQEAFGI
ncbi:MAG TPA: hypothetical protein VFF39_06525, partial [Verrucomicrobiae bacterium]|nr:hypothetical protein [Verrucomicrobiae bacterium]